MNSNLICRTCLKPKSSQECVSISLTEEQDSSILEMLSFTIPELDIYLVNNPAVCNNCLSLLKISFDFKTECIKNEEFILKHAQANKKLNLSEIKFLGFGERGCSKSGTTRETLGGEDISNKTRLLSCENCPGCISESFQNPVLHKKVHTEPYICYECKKSLDNIQDLRKHVLGHVKQRICKVCHKRFRDLYQLKTHLRVHVQTNPYKCRLCDKSFRQFYNLKEHLDQHVGSKNVSCKGCNKVFSTKYNAKIHMKNCQNWKAMEECDLCGERFLTKVQLIEHLHSTTQTCSGKEFMKNEGTKQETDKEGQECDSKIEIVKIEMFDLDGERDILDP